jgi:hypothetical protein
MGRPLGQANSTGAWAGLSPLLRDRFKLLFPNILINRNRFQLGKSIEICANVKKLQSKFCTNTLKHIYSLGMTKLNGLHYCLIENSYKLILGVINDKYS